MSYQDNFKSFWAEVESRACNNYGDFGTGEEIEVNINRAIQELADELKVSLFATNAIGNIIDQYGFSGETTTLEALRKDLTGFGGEVKPWTD